MKPAPPVQREAKSVEVQVAGRLRRLRRDKGLSLRGLTRLTGISEAYLSRIENHKASVTLSGLERLARALGVAISFFFEEEEAGSAIHVCRHGRGRRGRLRGAKGFAFELLAGAKQGKLMEPLVVDIASASKPMPLKPHPGEELDYVLEGEFDLFYGKERIRLRAGDAVYYDATVPHAARPVPGKPARILAVVASRDYLFHGDLASLLNGS